MIAFSVIIPVFNVEHYIEQCIRSVLSQNYPDYEIIIIDDGSDDRTNKLIQKLREKNPCIMLKSICHSGAGAARNVGLHEASGEYVIFLDADDYWINPYLLKSLDAKLTQQRADVVMFRMDKYTEDGKLLKKYRKAPLPADKACYRLPDVYEALVKDGQVLASACNKCVRRSMLISHHIEFQEGGYAEDIDWVLQLFSVAETISFINEISYAYRQHRKGSASKNRSGPNYQAKMIEGWAERMIRENISNKKAVAGLLAFEYGICFGYWHHLSAEMKKMMEERQYLLDYALDRKTKMIRRFKKIFGLHLTCTAIRIYLFIRRLSYGRIKEKKEK